MNTKKLLSTTVLYGFGDVIVLAVSSFLLMPLYTRELSQMDYGIYLITKTNTDILTYLLHFGLISTVGRLYFEYKKKNEHYQYLSSVLLFYLLVASLVTVALYFGGDLFWAQLSPNIPVYPYLWFCVAVAGFGFFNAFTGIWLRVEGKVSTFVTVQIASALLLLTLVIYNLALRHNGLYGILYSLVISAACTALVLPTLLWKRFSLRIRKEHIIESLHYSLPIMVGYFAYFILNKISIIFLQRYVSVEQIAIFGLGQQLAMIVTLASNAFAKSLQPMIFASEPGDLRGYVDKSGRLYLLLMSCLVNLAILFASEILRAAAPAKYSGGFIIFVILLLANFFYSASFIYDTILLYFKYPKTSVIVTIAGAAISLGLNLILVPRYLIYGAAFSTLISFTAVIGIGFYVSRKLVAHSGLKLMLRIVPVTLTITALTFAIHELVANQFLAIAGKVLVALVLVYVTYQRYTKSNNNQECFSCEY